MLKREWGAVSNAKLPHLLIPGKTAALVPEFSVEYLPSAELQPYFLSLQWMTWLWAELQPWFLSLQWETCLRLNFNLTSWVCSGSPAFEQNCNLGSWVCSGRPAFGTTATLIPEFAVEDLPLERTTTLVPEFAVEDLPSAELQLWFLSLQWKTCLRVNCNLGSCACSEGLALGQNSLMIILF